LCQAYEQLSFNLNPHACNALRNAALHMCEQSLVRGDEMLSVTVAYLGGRAEPPPYGTNGAGKADAVSKYIMQRLPAALEHETEILAPARSISGTELLAVRTQFKNLHVMPELLDLTDNACNGQQAATLQRDAAAKALDSQKPVAYWVRAPGSPGQEWQAVVAEPAVNGSIRWHFLTPDADDPSNSADGVTHHHIGDDGDSALSCHRIMLALDNNVNDLRDVAGVITEHLDQQSQASIAVRTNIELAVRAQLLEAAAEAGNAPVNAHPIDAPPPPDIVVRLPVDVPVAQPASAANEPVQSPASPLQKPVEAAQAADSHINVLREKHSAHNLRVVSNRDEFHGTTYKIASSMSDLTDVFNVNNARIAGTWKDGEKEEFEAKMERLKPFGIDIAFLDKAAAYIGTFEKLGGKCVLLERQNAPRELQNACMALDATGKQAGIMQFASRMGMCLNACYAQASKPEVKPLNLTQVKGAITELTAVPMTLQKNIDRAIAELQKVTKVNIATTLSWIRAGVKNSTRIKHDAAILIKALESLRELAAHPIFASFQEAFADHSEQPLLTLMQTLEALPRP
jgi:hypothetical protein